MNRHRWRFSTILVVALLVPAKASVAPSAPPKGEVPPDPQWGGYDLDKLGWLRLRVRFAEPGLLRDLRLADKLRLVARWRAARAFEQLAVMEGSLRFLNSLQKAEQDQPSREQRFLHFWAIDQLLGTAFASESDGDTARARGEAQCLVELFRAGSMAVGRDHRPDVSSLRGKYRGRIGTGLSSSPDHVSSIEAMHELLCELLPLGKPGDLVAEIVGDPGLPQAEGPMFVFTGTRHAGSCYLRLRDGRIASVFAAW